MLPLRDHLPTRTVPVVNYALIAANVLVFGLEVEFADMAKPSNAGRWCRRSSLRIQPTSMTRSATRALFSMRPCRRPRPGGGEPASDGAVGASGPITGALAAYGALYPRAPTHSSRTSGGSWRDWHCSRCFARRSQSSRSLGALAQAPSR